MSLATNKDISVLMAILVIDMLDACGCSYLGNGVLPLGGIYK